MTDTLETLTVADVERKKLQKHFGRFDILFFLVCTIVGVDTIATVAQGGGEAFTWMMIFAVVFFVPQALLFAELGTAFPQEGGPYYWTRLAFGHLAGAVNNFLYWITNPVWIGGTLAISCIGAVEVFFNNGNTVPTAVFYIIALAFVWVSIVAAITSFSVGKWVPTAGAFARFLLLGLFILTVIVFAAKHGAHGLGAASYSPTAGGFVLLVGVLLFNFVGFELPNSAGEEMTNPQRDVPFGIARSTVASVILYALPVIGILIVLPTTADHQLQRVHQRHPVGLHRVRRPRRGRRHGHADRGRPGPRRLLRPAVHRVPAHLRRDLDHGRGPGAGRVLLRRGGPPGAGRDQRQVRHAGAGQRVQRRRGHGRGHPGPADHQRQRGQVLQRRAGRDHLHHADQLPAHLPGAVEAAPQPPGHAPPVQDALAPAADRAC